MIAAKEDQNGVVGDDINKGLDLAFRRDEEGGGGQGVNGQDAGSGEFFRSG